MECGIQFGHQMKNAALDLCELWQDASIVLGPRNFPPTKNKSSYESLVEYAGRLRQCAKRLFIDPQLFAYADPSKNLRNFAYWAACQGDFRSNYKEVVKEICELNDRCKTNAIILPTVTADKIDHDWKELQKTLLGEARRYREASNLIASVALSAEVLRSDWSVDGVCQAAREWPVDGVYLVCERPGNAYLTDEPLWLLNLMQLVAGLKFAGKKVYVGYSSHQQLILTIAKCDLIFSGNHLNMRRFRTSDFECQDDSGPSRRATWYYAPQALSEYRVATLDLAYQQGRLEFLKPPFSDAFAGILFKGALPSSTAYNETASFLHYLDSLHAQCRQFSRKTYRDTYDFYSEYLQTAEKAIEGLQKQGIYDPARSFRDVLSANANAARAFDNTLGYQMGQRWSDI